MNEKVLMVERTSREKVLVGNSLNEVYGKYQDVYKNITNNVKNYVEVLFEFEIVKTIL